MNLLASIFRPVQPVPKAYQATFRHLYGDIAWFGVLSGSTLSFLAIFAARLGANPSQLGLLNAAPAIINLGFALPAAHWLESHAEGRPVFWSSLLFRIFYLALVPLPWIFHSSSASIWAILLITFIMNIPGTALAVGFNALFGDAVPLEWRGHVAGVRNSVLSLTTITSSLISGQILYRVEFPTGYQIVFAIGFIGALMSSYHLWYIRPVRDRNSNPNPLLNKTDQVIQGRENLSIRRKIWLWLLKQTQSYRQVRTDIIKGNFRKILALLFAFHLGQFLPIPLFSVYMVDVLKLTDQVISFGTAIFNVTVFIGSMQLARLIHLRGNKTITGIGGLLYAGFPTLLALSHGLGLFIFTNFVGGFAWAMVGGALYNYLLEKVPEDDRPAHMAWYNLALNAAILVGSLAGPALAELVGLTPSLFILAVIRFLAGLAILRFG